jgi:hypothetical protein
MSKDTKTILDTEITYLSNMFNLEGLKVMTLEETFDRIKEGASKVLINKIRNQYRYELKKKLPTTIFGGKYKNRTDLVESSGLAILDFDKVKDVKKLKELLKASTYILACWVSPSGNGIKALVRIPLVKDKKAYKEHYKSLLVHFEELYPDPATSDMNRLCYESYDPDIYINLNSEIYTDKIKPPAAISLKHYKKTIVDEGKVVDVLFRWWNKKYGYKQGERNSNLFILACKYSEFGVDKTITERVLNSFQSKDFSYSEIQKLIDSAYKRTIFNSKTLSI